MDSLTKKSPKHLSATKQARRKETHPAQGGRERCTGDSARGGNGTHGSWTTEWSTMAERLIGVQVDGARVPPGPRADGQHDHEDQSQPGHGSAGFCRSVNLGRAIGADQLRPDPMPVFRTQVPQSVRWLNLVPATRQCWTGCADTFADLVRVLVVNPKGLSDLFASRGGVLC